MKGTGLRRRVASLLFAAPSAALLVVAGQSPGPRRHRAVRLLDLWTAGRRAGVPGGTNDFPSLVHLQATDGHGTYAGVRYDAGVDGGFTLLRREPTGQVRELAHFRYLGVPYRFTDAVQVVGFDPSGGIIRSIQRTNPGTERTFIGVRFETSGRRVHRQLSPAWKSVQPVGISDTGVVLGTAVRAADLRRQVVSWSGAGKGTVSVLTLPGRAGTAITGTVDWFEFDAHDSYVHSLTGQRATLCVPGSVSVGNVVAASRTDGFGNGGFSAGWWSAAGAVAGRSPRWSTGMGGSPSWAPTTSPT